MGLFSTGATATPGPKASTDGAFEAPNRTERAHCWEARDAFFNCLDKHSIVDSIKEATAAGEKCGRENQTFEKDCASSWVSGLDCTPCKSCLTTDYTGSIFQETTGDGIQQKPDSGEAESGRRETAACWKRRAWNVASSSINTIVRTALATRWQYYRARHLHQSWG